MYDEASARRRGVGHSAGVHLFSRCGRGVDDEVPQYRSQNHVHLDYQGRALVTLADPHQPLVAGQEVGLQLANPLYFDAAGQRITIANEREANHAA